MPLSFAAHARQWHRWVALLVAGLMLAGSVSGTATAHQGDSSRHCNTFHVNPHFGDAVYPGTDNCGASHGQATVNSPADLPDQNPHDEKTL